MNSLFPVQNEYSRDFERLWRAYRYSRGKDDAYKAFRQMATQMPEDELLLLCISEYQADIKKTKVSQAYFGTWLRKRRWLDFIEEARYRLNNPLPAVPARQAFRSAIEQPDHPDYHKPVRSYLEILAERGAAK